MASVFSIFFLILTEFWIFFGYVAFLQLGFVVARPFPLTFECAREFWAAAALSVVFSFLGAI